MNAEHLTMFDGLDYERIAVLARFIRSQVQLAERPPPGRIEINNDEAELCARVLERFAMQFKREKIAGRVP